MSDGQHETSGTTSRRDFLKQTAAVGSAAALVGVARKGHAAQPLRVGLVGCGRRGTGAVRDCLQAGPDIVITAIGDLFQDHLEDGREKLKQAGVEVADNRCFSGFDAYRNVIHSDVDMVILAEPPGFRPQTFQAAVEAGKHVFMEKPAAVDPAGVRSIIATAKTAEARGLSVVAGTQRRHHLAYREYMKRIHDGAIGDIVSASCYWIGDYGYYPAVFRQAGWSDMEWQVRNWNYFTWLSGDHIVEQHVHNIDIMNWVFNDHPVKAIGMGGRQQRVGPEFGHIYDHFAVEFEYPGGVRVQSLSRQMAGTVNRVGEHIVGTRGLLDPREGITGRRSFTYAGDAPNPYVQEHVHLIESIRSGKPINEGRQIAESSMAAIIGRMAAYTGQEVSWDWAMTESTLDLSPPAYAFTALPETPVAIPGYTDLV